LCIAVVVVGEEPWLARRHGDEWERYRARVPRWLI
jgi:protein-S-isoprenylcysteine O-methyltransferase Ste14